MADPLYELFAFALDLYRAPLRFLPYVEIDRPIPRNFDALLEALNKREESEFWHDLSERLKASPEQLRNAGFFLVKRLLFAEGADHYRVLGLDSSADIVQTRERYRLLMALFHPDRNHHGGEWTEQYAPRINDAYNTLKNPQKKRSYDQDIRGGGHWGDDVPPPGHAGHGGAARPSGGDLADRETPLGEEDVVRVLPKRSTLHIWVGLVLLGLIGWFSVQVYESGGLKLAARNSGKAVSEGEPVAPASAVENAHRSTLKPVAGKGEEAGGEGVSQELESNADAKDDRIVREPEILEVGARSGQSVGSGQQPGSVAGIIGAPVANRDKETACSGGNCEQADDPGPSEEDRASGDAVVLVQAVKKPPADAVAESVAVDGGGSTLERDATAGPPLSGDAPAQGDSAQKKKIIVGQRDIDFLVSRFIRAYEAGDVGRFVGLFSREARGNKGIGRELLAEQYGDLFRTTRKRSMMIRDVMWAPKADGVARISFFVAIETERRGSSETEEYVGDVDLLVYMDQEKLKISKFIHRVGKR